MLLRGASIGERERAVDHRAQRPVLEAPQRGVEGAGDDGAAFSVGEELLRLTPALSHWEREQKEIVVDGRIKVCVEKGEP